MFYSHYFSTLLKVRHQEGSGKKDGFKLNGTDQLLAYADDVNILVGSIYTVKENAEALVIAAKEIGLEVNADKTMYMVMFQVRKQKKSQYKDC